MLSVLCDRNMFSISLKTGLLFLAVVCNYQSLAIAPEIQTNVFRGVPDNWATQIDIDPFVKIGQKYYFIETKNPINWFAAANECRRRNAHLAAIENVQELEAIAQYLRSHDMYPWLWTSGNDLAQYGSFYWAATGQPISYARWANGYPQNRGGEEHCMFILVEDDTFKVRVRECQHTTPYICEASTPRTVAFTIW